MCQAIEEGFAVLKSRRVEGLPCNLAFLHHAVKERREPRPSRRPRHEVCDDANEKGGHVARGLLCAHVRQDQHREAADGGDEHRAADLRHAHVDDVAGRALPTEGGRGEPERDQ
jgi:hypothetical protein